MNNLEELNSSNAAEQVPYSAIQHNVDTIAISSAEMGQLWSTYMAQSMSKCMVPFFIEKCKDADIRSLLQFVLDVSNRHVNSITEIFNKSSIPVPHGFTDEDFDINAKPLYGDTFMLLYSKFMAKYGMINFSFARSISVRPDIIGFFEGCLNDFNEISNRSSNVGLSKGLVSRAPNIPIPDRVEFVTAETSFFKGLMGDKRPLNALEIGHIFVNVHQRQLEDALLLGFGQVAKSKKIKNYFSRGKQIIDKQVGVLGSLLEDEDLPKPINYDYLVTDSTESPYSDKLMLFHSTIFLAHSISGYGLALANCARADIVSSLTRLMAEFAGYVKDGLDLMIENGWFEKIPEAANRKELRTMNN
ncbi:MAG TPA: DUF3231 family protein [Desulfosporosinus sp.]|nr:DUF3231 family protein [Desulfosporosinus sp.]